MNDTQKQEFIKKDIPKIGIIGGAGVAATNKLLELVENKITSDGAFRDCHHPEMIIYQATQAPSRSMFLEGKGESFIGSYIEIAKILKNAGAKKIAMCCNTAHYAIEEISKEADIEFINLVEQTVLKAKKTGHKNIGLIASEGCIKGQVYEKYFKKHFPHATIIYPELSLQEEVTKGICNIKNISRFLDEAHEDRPQNIFKKITKKLYEKGAETIIVGCTDIRTDFVSENTLDTLEILAQLIIEEIK